ncbi:MAG: hypothetical protein D9N11_07220 [Ketobacter sp.]|nr:MAG: hypothetical protein D9N11_07220 [Ketobacter sp.]
MRTLMALLLTLYAAMVSAQQTAEVYETYLPANKLVPILEQLLGPDDKITAYRNKLFVKAPPAVQDELLRVLQEIDRPLRNIQVSLRYADNADIEAESTSADANVVVYHGGSNRAGVDVAVVNKNRFSTHAEESDHQIRVLEGEQGALDVGQEVAVEQIVFLGPWQTGSVKEYRNVSNQLFVVPRIVRDKIRIEVFTTNQRMKMKNDGKIQKTDAETVVLVEPGEWTPIAGSTQTLNRSSGSVSSSTRRSGSSGKSLQIRADILD